MSKKDDEKKSFERREVLMRIVVFIVSGIILDLWGYLVFALVIVNLFYTLFTGKRNQEFSEICEIWNTQLYVFVHYISFMTNERPFPFKNLSKRMSKFSK